MISIIVISRAGDASSIDAASHQTIMRAIRDAGFDELQAVCGGGGSCGTCHVYVGPDFAGRLPAMAPYRRNFSTARSTARPSPACRANCPSQRISPGSSSRSRRKTVGLDRPLRPLRLSQQSDGGKADHQPNADGPEMHRNKRIRKASRIILSDCAAQPSHSRTVRRRCRFPSRRAPDGDRLRRECNEDAGWAPSILRVRLRS